MVVTFKKFGIGVKWVTENDPAAYEAAIDENTKAIFIESIANPKYVVADIPALAEVHCIGLLQGNDAHVLLLIGCAQAWYPPRRGQHIRHGR